MKKTIINALILCLFCGVVSCNTAYHKETDEMIAQCEQLLQKRDPDGCQSKVFDIKNYRDLTQEQSIRIGQIEHQIEDLYYQIEQERLEAEREAARKAEEERIARIEAFKRKIAGTYHFTGFSWINYVNYFGTSYFDHIAKWDVDIFVKNNGDVYMKESNHLKYDKNDRYIGKDDYEPERHLIGRIEILDENTFTIVSDEYTTLFYISQAHDGKGNFKSNGRYCYGQCVFDFNGRKLYQSPYSSEYIEFTFTHN